jgi:hypothetical protein
MVAFDVMSETDTRPAESPLIVGSVEEVDVALNSTTPEEAFSELESIKALVVLSIWISEVAAAPEPPRPNAMAPTTLSELIVGLALE